MFRKLVFTDFGWIFGHAAVYYLFNCVNVYSNVVFPSAFLLSTSLCQFNNSAVTCHMW